MTIEEGDKRGKMHLVNFEVKRPKQNAWYGNRQHQRKKKEWALSTAWKWRFEEEMDALWRKVNPLNIVRGV